MVSVNFPSGANALLLFLREMPTIERLHLLTKDDIATIHKNSDLRMFLGECPQLFLSYVEVRYRFLDT